MKKIIFVCLGNICRSPMAEMMFADLLQEHHLADDISVSSMATANYEIGNHPHPGAIAELRKQHIPLIEHVAQQITAQDIHNADLVVGMDEQNILDLKQIAAADDQKKIFKAYNVLNSDKNIADPWYDHKFDRTFNELSEVLPAWIKKMNE